MSIQLFWIRQSLWKMKKSMNWTRDPTKNPWYKSSLETSSIYFSRWCSTLWNVANHPMYNAFVNNVGSSLHRTVLCESFQYYWKIFVITLSVSLSTVRLWWERSCHFGYPDAKFEFQTKDRKAQAGLKVHLQSTLPATTSKMVNCETLSYRKGIKSVWKMKLNVIDPGLHLFHSNGYTKASGTAAHKQTYWTR